MARMRLLIVVALVAVLVVPLVALAQDGEGEPQTYTSPDSFLTLSFPAEWVAQENEFLYGAVLANSQEVFDTMEAATEEEMVAVPSGGVIVDITLASVDTFQSFGMEVEAGMSVEEVLDTFLTFISTPPEDMMGGAEGEDMGEGEMAATEEAGMEMGEGEMAATEEAGMDMGMEAPVVGEIQTVEFEDGRVAAWAPVEYPNASSDAYLVFEVGDGIYSVVNVYAAPGELTQDLIDTTIQVAQSIQFTGTADDLALPEPEVEESEVDPTTLDGDALVNERCTVCHTRERIDAQDKDEAGWTATVDRMISYGADLDSAERQAVIDYLVATH